ncbi:MAG: hypothetical protein ABW131_00240 [Candidatus Sedimenticola sp. 6PFRAG5]
MQLKCFNVQTFMVTLLFAASVVGFVHAETSLGRLFTSATDRASLNKLRNADVVQVSGDGIREEKRIDVPDKPEESAVDLILNGVVIRSDGQKTIWINGQQVKPGAGVDNVHIFGGADSNSHIVVGAPGKRAVKLKPGQRLDSGSGQVQESYRMNTVVTPKGGGGD